MAQRNAAVAGKLFPEISQTGILFQQSSSGHLFLRTVDDEEDSRKQGVESGTTTSGLLSKAISGAHNTITITAAAPPLRERVNSGTSRSCISGIRSLTTGTPHDSIRLNSINSIMHNPISAGFLFRFCESQYCSESIRFIIEIDRFREYISNNQEFFSGNKSWRQLDQELFSNFVQIDNNNAANLKSEKERIQSLLDSGDLIPSHNWPSSIGASCERVQVQAMMKFIWDDFLSDNAPNQIFVPCTVLKHTILRMQTVHRYGRDVFQEALSDPVKTIDRDIRPRFMRSNDLQELRLRIEDISEPASPQEFRCPPPAERLHMLSPTSGKDASPLVAGSDAVGGGGGGGSGGGVNGGNAAASAGNAASASSIASSLSSSISPSFPSSTSAPASTKRNNHSRSRGLSRKQIMDPNFYFSLEDVLNDKLLFRGFSQYLANIRALENLRLVRAVRYFKELINQQQLEQQQPQKKKTGAALSKSGKQADDMAWSIYHYFMVPGACFEISVSTAELRDIMRRLALPQADMFATAENNAFILLKQHYKDFKTHADYQDLKKSAVAYLTQRRGKSSGAGASGGMISSNPFSDGMGGSGAPEASGGDSKNGASSSGVKGDGGSGGNGDEKGEKASRYAYSCTGHIKSTSAQSSPVYSDCNDSSAHDTALILAQSPSLQESKSKSTVGMGGLLRCFGF